MLTMKLRGSGRHCYGAAVVVFVLVLLVIVLGQAGAQTGAERTIQLQTADIGLISGVFELGSERYAVLQLARDLNRAEIEELARDGVRLLSYLGEGVYVAGVDAGALTSSVAGQYGIEAAAPWRAENKATAALRQGVVQQDAQTAAGLLKLNVLFFSDVGPEAMKDILERHTATYRIEGPPFLWQVTIEPGRLLSLLREQGIHVVEPTVPSRAALDDVRALLNVDQVHQASIFDNPPSIQYDGLTGKGVTLQVSEFVWDGHPDFIDAQGKTRFINDPLDSFGTQHGTHVAGIMGGDGLLSASLPDTPFYANPGRWRGVAPEALLYDWRYFGGEGPLIDAANFSKFFFQPEYSTDFAAVDGNVRGENGRDFQFPHVIAAANNGNGPHIGNDTGYYSLLSPSKNSISVGSVNANDGGRSEFSSMGPTFDGRIKPDVMAPGGKNHVPNDFNANEDLIRMEIDYIRIVNESSGAVEESWEFNNDGDTQGWFEAGALYGISNIMVSDGKLKFDMSFKVDEYGQETPYGWNWDMFLATNAEQAVVMRYKMTMPMGTMSAAGQLWYHHQGYSDNVFGKMEFPVTASGSWLVATIQVGKWGMNGAETSFGAWTESATLDRLGMAVVAKNWPEVASTFYDEKSVDTYAYYTVQGTSMAAPAATGSVALILQQFHDRHGLDLKANPPLPSTVKAVLIQTAEDLVHDTADPRDQPNPDTGTPVLYYEGPDFATGYGLIDVKAAVDLIAADPGPGAAARLIHEGKLDAYQEHVYEFTLSAAEVTALDEGLKFTLAWDDYPGDPATDQSLPKLVNDLDLYLIGPDGTVHRPWTLEPLPQAQCGDDPPGCGDPDPITPADIKPAHRAADHRNNVEMVQVDTALAGRWQVVIYAFDMPMATQTYSLVGNQTVEMVTHEILANPEGLISAGEYHTCGLTPFGRADCWGAELEADNHGQADDQEGPFKLVAAGALHSCGLRLDGDVDCWGSNDHGQAEDQTGPFIQIAAGLDHNCGLKSDGSVDCWGRNDRAQAEDKPGPYIQVSAGLLHTCALTVAGRIECWGMGNWGEEIGKVGPFNQVSAGWGHTCGLTLDGNAQCWGRNDDGQAVNKAGPFTQISAGGRHTCGLKTDGSVDCWGFNFGGQAEDQPGPYLQISAGGTWLGGDERWGHTCGLRPDGSVDCWGSNQDGQAADQPGPFGPYQPHALLPVVLRD